MMDKKENENKKDNNKKILYAGGILLLLVVGIGLKYWAFSHMFANNSDKDQLTDEQVIQRARRLAEHRFIPEECIPLIIAYNNASDSDKKALAKRKLESYIGAKSEADYEYIYNKHDSDELNEKLIFVVPKITNIIIEEDLQKTIQTLESIQQLEELQGTNIVKQNISKTLLSLKTHAANFEEVKNHLNMARNYLHDCIDANELNTDNKDGAFVLISHLTEDIETMLDYSFPFEDLMEEPIEKVSMKQLRNAIKSWEGSNAQRALGIITILECLKPSEEALRE